MKIYQFWRKIIILFMLLWIYLLLVAINRKQQQANDILEENLREKLTNVFLEVEHLHKNNVELKQQIIGLTKKLKIFKNSKSKQKNLNEPSKDYELLRRRIYSNMKEFWYYISFELRLLATSVKNKLPFIMNMKTNIDEHYRSLLNDIDKLTKVDGYAQWRRKEYIYLSTLVKKRIKILQNPQDCSKAKKLACNLISDHRSCGYGCRLHHLVNCMVVAYATKRTLVLDNPHNWGFSIDGFTSLFFPLSNLCTSINKNETILPWPGDESVQVVNLSLPITKLGGPNREQKPQLTLFNPLILPEDLSHRLNVLHGDPAVWWIGQFVKYIIRPKLSTIDIFENYENFFGFSGPVVGVHIRRTNKSPFHTLEEYMYHVEEYYKLQESNGIINTKKIYLATDDPKLYNEAYNKYPEYQILGNAELSEAGSVRFRELDNSIMNININIYFLSRCDYLVCTFSSHVCRLAYELMNGIKFEDASAQFTSLDDVYYFNNQIRRLNVAVLPHKANGPQKMDLQVGDEIEVIKNQWNGYSKGTNLRTNKSLLYPTFKVTQKIEIMSFPSYPDIKISAEELEE
ncbi:alpha-(1,6)-fucosyltransferase-like [Rhopalosiphum maidis]|uniref:alpha-(1,6)-fucosyltransferase-like n=1 Tax=Rhopalosiphum maidis TaxID=43146 RepID=UPI000EFFCA67|nr:alpha-(1,6)-fucosyltransferase-like [Rhopalosiphum maidis]